MKSQDIFDCGSKRTEENEEEDNSVHERGGSFNIAVH